MEGKHEDQESSDEKRIYKNESNFDEVKKSKRGRYNWHTKEYDKNYDLDSNSTYSHLKRNKKNAKKRSSKMHLTKNVSENASNDQIENGQRNDQGSHKNKKREIRDLTGQVHSSSQAQINLLRHQLIHVQKFVAKNRLDHSDFNLDSMQEMSLESMGCFKDNLPWESISIPERRNLYDAIKDRINNYTNPDIVLIIENHEFFCHRIVLQSYSDFFESISRSKGRAIHMDEKITKKAFIAIYSWMLSEGQGGYDFIKKSNILEVLIAAEILSIKDIEKQCHSIIESKEAFSEENAFFLLVEASFWDKTCIKDKMVPRIRKFFLPLVSSWNFTQLCLDDLCNILESNYIIIHCELEVFMAAVRWLRSDWEGRKKYLLKVMKSIRFGLMTPVQLVDIRKNPESPEFSEITEEKLVQIMIEEGLAYSVENTLTGSTDDHKSRCDLLKLVKPEQRNFAVENKEYKNYQHFIEYLEQIRMDPNNYDIHPRNTEDKISIHDSECPEPSVVKDQKMSNTDLLFKKSRTSLVDVESQCGCGDYAVTPTKPVKSEKSHRRISLKENAAVVIQSTYRGYRARNNVLHLPGNHISIKKESNNSSTDKPTNSASMSLDKKKQSILIFGGLPQASKPIFTKSCAVYKYDCVNNEWDLISNMTKPRCYHGAAKLRGKIYLVGGNNQNREEQQTLCSESLSFDPSSLQWSEEPSLITSRQSFAHTTLHGFLYVVGGEGSNKKVLSSVERYNPGNKLWEEVQPLPEPCLGAVSCSYNGQIWVAGGMNGHKQQISNQVFCYDPEEDVWLTKPPLRFGRAFASLVSHNGALYLVGGATSEDNKIISVDAIDVWDDQTSTWKFKVNMPIPRHGHTVSFLDNHMLIIGGTSTKCSRALNQVDAWCMKTGTWNKLIAPLETPIIGHCSVNIEST